MHNGRSLRAFESSLRWTSKSNLMAIGLSMVAAMDSAKPSEYGCSRAMTTSRSAEAAAIQIRAVLSSNSLA